MNTTPENIDIPSLLKPERVIICGEATKKAVLSRLIDTLTATDAVTDPDAFRTAVYAREELMSTGIGMGIGIPHVRLPSVKKMVMAVAVCNPPVSDYEALDDQPVGLVIMIAGHDDQHSHYLRTLAAISSMLKNETFKTSLQNAATPEEAFALLDGYGS